MDILDAVLSALPAVLAWQNVLAMVVGTLAGMTVGSLPG